MIPPDQFILPAEQTGLIRPLTEWVLLEAQRQCFAWGKEGLSLSIAINLSARSLNDKNLPEWIANILKDCEESSAHLEFEITESTLMIDEDNTEKTIQKLQDMGIQFAIDDFGTGYSSLVYLKKLSVDSIKIDKSFIKNLTSNKADLTIVQSTINLGHDLGIKVVAEGVEDQKTVDKLIDLGCDAAQGYYICRPIPAVELSRWFHDEAPKKGWTL